MSYELYPSDLTDTQWQYIKELLPAAKPGGRPRQLDMRLVVNAILYVVVGGIQWRMLPQEYPKWPSVYYYFARWRDDGTWHRIHDTLRAHVRRRAGRHKHPSAGCLDSQTVKRAARPGPHGVDAGKHCTGRKRHVLVDTLGLLLVVVVTAASLQDRDGARLVLRQRRSAWKTLRRVWVDGAYRGQLLDWAWHQRRLTLQVVQRADGQRGFVVLPRRWVVERTFAWLSQARRLSKDYEELPTSSEAIIYITMIRLMLRRLARTSPS
jgi:putative transposase